MKRRISIIIMAILLLVSIAAFAETKNYGFSLSPIDDPANFSVDSTSRGQKSDSEQKFYVTQTYNGFTDSRKIYYRSILPGRVIASDYLYFTGSTVTTKSADYLSGKGNMGAYYYIGCATQAINGDYAARDVHGRWTP